MSQPSLSAVQVPESRLSLVRMGKNRFRFLIACLLFLCVVCASIVSYPLWLMERLCKRTSIYDK